MRESCVGGGSQGQYSTIIHWEHFVCYRTRCSMDLHSSSMRTVIASSNNMLLSSGHRLPPAVLTTKMLYRSGTVGHREFLLESQLCPPAC